MQLEFVRKVVSYGAYGGTIEKCRLTSQLAIIQDAIDGNCRSLLTTQVTPKKGFVFKSPSMHLLAVDCDSPADLRLTIAAISSKYNFTVVESSPEHFWVFTDQIVTWERLITELGEMPGADKNFVQASARCHCLAFRAFPKNVGYPMFPVLKFSPGLARDWYIAAQEYYNGRIFKALEAIILQPSDKPVVRTEPYPVNFCPRCGVMLNAMKDNKLVAAS